MKKIISTMILCSYLICAYAQTKEPTKEETIDYLNNFYGSNSNSSGGPATTIEYSLNLIQIKKCTRYKTVSKECMEYKVNDFVPKDITAIKLEFQPYKKIDVETTQNAVWVVTFITTAKGVQEIYLDGTKEKEYVEKFKKAMTRLATLSGAKLIKEDLF